MATITALLAELDGIGRDPAGGYSRMAWSPPDLELREWFVDQAASRGLDLVEDGNGNQLAWWGSDGGASLGGTPRPGRGTVPLTGGNALLVGSHLDSVRGGGGYDGPLGVASGFAAVDALRAAGFTPSRPLAVANFTDEEGARFGVACLGSRLATGVLAPDQALALRDETGVTMAEAMQAAGRDPGAAGPSDWLDSVGTFIELHIEQGRALVDSGHAVGVASAIWPHGRYRFELEGEGNHAGTTRMTDRHDPMLTFAAAVMSAAAAAEETDLRATFGRLQVVPGNTNAVPSRVTAWLDARADTDEALAGLVERILADTRKASAVNGTRADLVVESVTPAVEFDPGLRQRLATLLDAPVLPTGAGHDAGILASRLSTAMLFVRNPTGISHSPLEHATADDCDAGVAALVRVIEELA